MMLCIILSLACVYANSARAQGPEADPLLPHPVNRPVYSQDRFKKPAVPVEVPPTLPEQNQFTHDRYRWKKVVKPDYTGELRKTPEKGREWSEIEIAKGMIALNAGRDEEAEKRFQDALKQDARNFVALEYLAEVRARKGDIPGAIGYFAKAKHIAPEGRWGAINFQIGRLYLIEKNYERAEIYLKLALDQGGQPTAVHYGLGYLYYLQERFFEAERHLHEAKTRAERKTARDSEKSLLQATNFYLGDIYSRLGFSRYAIQCLRETEFGESPEVRNGAWRVHSELNHFQAYLSLGAFGQYDSNVILLPQNSQLPSSIASEASLASVLLVQGGVQTSPAKRWTIGADANFYYNMHLDRALESYDVLNLAGAGWVNYWNFREWSFTGRLDLNDALTDRSSLARYQSSVAPSVMLSYVPFQRWNWDLGFQYRANSFATDIEDSFDQRSGTTYSTFFRASLKAPNPWWRPTFGYTFEVDATKGQNFRARAHILVAELDLRLFSKAHLTGGVTFAKTDFPDHLRERADTMIQMRGVFTYLFSEHWNVLADLAVVRNDSTLNDFTYSRATFTSGLVYDF